jgi:hypothetical protein
LTVENQSSMKSEAAANRETAKKRADESLGRRTKICDYDDIHDEFFLLYASAETQPINRRC